MPIADKSSADWAAEYELIRPKFVAFTDALSHELEMLLEDRTASVAQLEARTKSVRSFREKIDRKAKYTAPLREITDLSGLRVVVPSPADIAPVGRLIEANFEIDRENSVSSGADHEPDRFGYRAEHYIVRLKPEQCGLAAWSKFSDCSAEFQVRTVMQHAWAAIDHKIRYKGSSLPAALQRRLFRLSALLELADEQFSALQSNSAELSESYTKSVANGDLDVELDALSLAAYIEEAKVGTHWAQAASGLGYSSPSVDRMDSAGVLETMLSVDLRSLADLQAVLGSAHQWGDAALARILEFVREGTAPGDKFAAITAYSDDVLKLLLLFNARSPAAILDSDFRIDIQEGLLRAIGA